MGSGKSKSSPAETAAAPTQQVTTTETSASDDEGRPGTREVNRYATAERRDAALIGQDGGSESGGDDPMGSRRKVAGGRQSSAMLG